MMQKIIIFLSNADAYAELGMRERVKKNMSAIQNFDVVVRTVPAVVTAGDLTADGIFVYGSHRTNDEDFDEVYSAMRSTNIIARTPLLALVERGARLSPWVGKVFDAVYNTENLAVTLPVKLHFVQTLMSGPFRAPDLISNYTTYNCEVFPRPRSLDKAQTIFFSIGEEIEIPAKAYGVLLCSVREPPLAYPANCSRICFEEDLPCVLVQAIGNWNFIQMLSVRIWDQSCPVQQLPLPTPALVPATEHEVPEEFIDGVRELNGGGFDMENFTYEGDYPVYEDGYESTDNSLEPGEIAAEATNGGVELVAAPVLERGAGKRRGYFTGPIFKNVMETHYFPTLHMASNKQAWNYIDNSPTEKQRAFEWLQNYLHNNIVASKGVRVKCPDLKLFTQKVYFAAK